MSEKLPQTQEYFEAYQDDMTKNRKREVELYSEADKAKAKAVEDAVEIMVNAGVRFYLFPILPADTKKDGQLKEVAWQFNSLPAFVKYDENDRPSQESIDLCIKTDNAVLYTIFNTFVRGIPDEVPFDECMKHFMSIVFNGYVQQSRINAGTENEEEE